MIVLHICRVFLLVLVDSFSSEMGYALCSSTPMELFQKLKKKNHSNSVQSGTPIFLLSEERKFLLQVQVAVLQANQPFHGMLSLFSYPVS